MALMPLYTGPVLLCDACGRAIRDGALVHEVLVRRLARLRPYSTQPEWRSGGDEPLRYHGDCLALPPLPGGLPPAETRLEAGEEVSA